MKITLCGSTRFKEEYEEWNRKLTLAGHIVYSVACFGHQPGVDLTTEEKTKLDLIHLLKILNSDAIFVLDVDGYIGESTSKEVIWAGLINKPVYYLSASGPYVCNLLGIKL